MTTPRATSKPRAEVDVAEQRRLLAELVKPGFMATQAAQEFIGRLRTDFGGMAVARSRRMGYWLETEEVVNLLVVKLLEDDGAMARRVSCAVNPWAYLSTCLTGWLQHEWGVRATPLETLTPFLPSREMRPGSDDLTELSVAIDLTCTVLDSRTPQQLTADVHELVKFFAHNPVQRKSYDQDERDQASQLCPALSLSQIVAVKNISWGSRPRQHQTSILGAFLLDAAFNPENSPTHIRALRTYSHALTNTCTTSSLERVAS